MKYGARFFYMQIVKYKLKFWTAGEKIYGAESDFYRLFTDGGMEKCASFNGQYLWSRRYMAGDK